MKDTHVPLEKLSTIKIKRRYRCPICNEAFPIEINKSILPTIIRFPYAHVVIHGDPPHAIIVYIDAHQKIRGIERCESFQILKSDNPPYLCSNSSVQ